MTKKLSKGQKRLQTKKAILILFLGSVFITILCIYGFFYSVKEYNHTVTYDQLEKKEYTFTRFEKNDGIYYFYVSEQEKPLLITSVTMHPKLFDNIDELDSGDKLTCYVKNTDSRVYSFEVVEIIGENEVLTLEKYNQENKNNGLIGLIITPIFTLISVFLSVLFGYGYKTYKK